MIGDPIDSEREEHISTVHQPDNVLRFSSCSINFGITVKRCKKYSLPQESRSNWAPRIRSRT